MDDNILCTRCRVPSLYFLSRKNLRAWLPQKLYNSLALTAAHLFGQDVPSVVPHLFILRAFFACYSRERAVQISLSHIANPSHRPSQEG